MVSSKTYDDVTSEFALGQVAFYPNGVVGVFADQGQ